MRIVLLAAILEGIAYLSSHELCCLFDATLKVQFNFAAKWLRLVEEVG